MYLSGPQSGSCGSGRSATDIKVWNVLACTVGEPLALKATVIVAATRFQRVGIVDNSSGMRRRVIPEVHRATVRV